jgi:hypothetical protein
LSKEKKRYDENKKKKSEKGTWGFHYCLHENFDFNLHEGFIIKNGPNLSYFVKKIPNC